MSRYTADRILCSTPRSLASLSRGRETRLLKTHKMAIARTDITYKYGWTFALRNSAAAQTAASYKARLTPEHVCSCTLKLNDCVYTLLEHMLP